MTNSCENLIRHIPNLRTQGKKMFNFNITSVQRCLHSQPIKNTLDINFKIIIIKLNHFH